MGTMKRIEPGQENKIQEGPKISLSPRLQPIESKFKRIVPGPGAYTPHSFKQANFSFSFGLKIDNSNHIKYVKEIPGPGQYDVHKIKHYSQIGASLDKSQRDSFQNKTQKIVPGPGAYQSSLSYLISRNSGPKYGFGTSKRANTSHDAFNRKSSNISDSIDSPGPGQYELKNIIGNDGPKSSLSYRYKADLKAKESIQKPGPGQYQPEITAVIKQSPNYRIGSSTRESYYLKEKFKFELPPPNIYNPKIDRVKQSSPSTGFGYGDRNYLNKTQLIPGPGMYRTQTSVGEGPKFHMGLKLEDSFTAKRASALPSPDRYQPKYETIHQRAKSFKVGSAQRQTLARINNVPGPGSYNNIDSVVAFKNSPRFGFGSSSQRPQFKEKTEIPGPGAYKVNTMIADVPKYLIPNQKEEFKYV